MNGIEKEALRYIGYKGEPDNAVKALLARAEREFAAVNPKFCFGVFKKSDCGALLLGGNIKNHLKDSETVVFFAATLGAAADRIIRAAEVSDMAYALVADAYASAFIEDFCDSCEEKIKAAAGGSLTWRFSAGYGDYPISLQNDIITLLSADKKIGLTAAENHILIPRKSVTAVMGVIGRERGEKINKCESCNMKDRCSFRKDGKSCGR